MAGILAVRPNYWRAGPGVLPVLDFLCPSFNPSNLRRRRCASTIATTSTPIESEATEASTKPKQPRPLSQELQRFLDGALRVNQAGELAATLIYTHQTPHLLRTHPQLRTLMAHMYDQEAGHFDHFNKLLAKHRVRPTALYPVWVAASSFLGWSTGLMGREAAMACTEAVETEIGDHYNEQVRVLLEWVKETEERGEEVGQDFRALIEDLKRIRDEELEHLDEAVREGAKEAKPYQLLNQVIRRGCRGAIWISERV